MSDHASLWMTDAPPIASDPLPSDDRVHDLVVIGAGITGLTAATMFARRGLDVAVLEARDPGAVTTGHTTAKVTQLQGTMLQRIRGRATASTLAAYVESQAAAFDWLAGFASVNGIGFERRDAVSYASTPQGVAHVEAEHRLARAHGLQTELVDDAGLPFRTYRAVRLREQGQIEPLQLVAALARELRDAGGTLTAGARVTGVKAGRSAESATVHVGARMLRARRVVLATGHVILDRGLYFAKLAAKRSYAQAWRVADDQLPTAMYLGVEQPTRSVRDARGLLVTGGNSHGVGRAASEQAQADDLAAWTRENWPRAEPVAGWSAQDYLTPHGVPFVGWLPRGGGKVYLAAGFSKWGMTNGVATALTLVGDILGDSAGWQRTLHRRVTLPAAFAVGLGENLAVARWYATSWARALTHPVPERTLEGHGEVGRRGLVPTAVSTVAGTTREVCAVCPHLGAVVQWNDYERSWDCPAHGSRFAADGTLLEGPATRGLRPAPTP